MSFLAGNKYRANLGSLKIARRPQDAEVIKVDFERGRRNGLDVELISPQQACRLNPFFEADGRRKGDEDR